MNPSDYPTIISFFTKTWEYEAHANRLRTECKRLNLNCYIKEYPDSGKWLSNTRIKASFIHDAMVELKAPVLWIDVDGSILKVPELLKLPTVYDFMGRHQRTGPRRTWHVGTLFFNYNEKTLALTRLWKEATLHADGSDEASFENIWLKHHIDLGMKVKELPPEYFNILNGNQGYTPESVICHRLSKCESKMEMKRRANRGNV